MAEQTPLQKALARKQALWSERSSWLTHWRELSEYQQPRAGRFLVTDRNRGQKRHNLIYDSSATQSLRTLAAGLMSGITSPARPWFRLALSDKQLMEQGDVKIWLNKVTELMRAVFASSNTYRSLHGMYADLGLFGTASTVVLPDYDNVIHHYPMPAGSYALATNHKGQVDTVVREFEMTAVQVVRQFGLDKVSAAVKSLFESGAYDKWVTVVHIVEPNTDRNPAMMDGPNMRFSSKYFEPSQVGDNKFLSESGFKRFPALCPRWEVTGNDAYGSSPGMEALGDVKQLQFQQLRKAQGIDYMTNPPIVVPTSYKDAVRGRLPGGVMFADINGPAQTIKSAFDVHINLQHLLGDIQDVRERIKSTYYADLFLMLANDTRSGITATEVAERHEEKLLMLGPVLERLHNELLQPLIDITFENLASANALPQPPEALQGMELQVEFISVLAQAQRAVAAQGVDRLLGTVSSLAAGSQDMAVWDKINKDQVIDDYGDMFGVNPEIIVPDDVVAQIRADRAKQQEAMQAAASMPEVAQTAQTASQINPQGLTDVMTALQGYSTPATI
jgi:hypothetical protein